MITVLLEITWRDHASTLGRHACCELCSECKARPTRIKVYGVIKQHTIGIRRHIKIKADANPYMPKYAEYFWNRLPNKESKLLTAMSAVSLGQCMPFKRLNQSGSSIRAAFERLEPYDGKLSCTVHRGLGAGDSPLLPGLQVN